MEITRRNVSIFTIGVVTLLAMAWLAKATVSNTFLGPTTAEIARCKKNPRYNPARCRELLSSRRAPKRRASTFDAVGSSSPGGLYLGQ